MKLTLNKRSGDKIKYILGQKQAFNFRTILDPTLFKKIEKNYRHTHTQIHEQ